MKLGFIGLGKLGMPCAVALASKGHDVIGYDIDATVMSKTPRAYRETGPDGIEPFDPYLASSTLRFGSLDDVAQHAEIIFVAVQTPHAPEYEGVTRLPNRRADFDYRFLRACVAQLAASIVRPTDVVVISTVLPGTIRQHVIPLANEHMRICYNPFFIAMGTTLRDFLFPEFILFGVHSPDASKNARKLYGTITSAPIYETSIENAELIKVAYNTFIGMKIVFANTVMEICHKTPGANADEVMGGLKLAKRRLISNAYLKGGMGDGGGCHPRDNIAMSYLARQLDLSCDFFEMLMTAREKQTEFLAKLFLSFNLPKVILGYSFKAETSLTVGSPAVLLANICREQGHDVRLLDPMIEGIPERFAFGSPCVYLLGADHSIFRSLTFPSGSVVIDPWRMMSNPQPEIKYIPVGIGSVISDNQSEL